MAKILFYWRSFWFITMILYTTCGFAQFTGDDDEGTFLGGVVAGGNFTQVDGDYFAGYHKAGLNTGLIVYMKLGAQVSSSMELLFAQKGSRAGQNQVPKRSNDQSMVLTDYKIRLNYLEVPIQINYYDKKKNHFGGGLSYARLFSSKEEYRDNQGNIFENDARLFPFRKSDIGLVLTGNLHIWKGLFVTLRYQYSLVSIRNLYNPVTGRGTQFNNVWTTRLMYLF